jgi:hypothetical protein
MVNDFPGVEIDTGGAGDYNDKVDTKKLTGVLREVCQPSSRPCIDP